MIMYECFFFSSRRRHTRWNCDWSSDVCSSDLLVKAAIGSGCFTDRMPGFVMEQSVHQGGEQIVVAGLAAGDTEPAGLTDDQILDQVDATMSAVVGRPITRIFGYVKSWTHDPWSRAVVRAPIGDQRDSVLPVIAAPLDGRLFFAGEHTDNRVGPGRSEEHTSELQSQ